VKAQDYDTGTVYTLATDIIAAVENVIGTGGNDTITGSTEANRVEGGDGIDLLKGGAGNDTLRGGSGADNMAGGTGNDTYYADDSGDKTIEKTGQGTDTVYSTASWTLGSNVEILRLQGRGDLAGTGNSLDNRLFGNEGANLLRGGNGDDALSGGAGGDTLEGGAGNDTLTGGSGADVFRFAAKAPTGADRITDFDGAVDRFDLSGAAFSALAVAANGDTVLTHASGTVRIVGISGLTLAEWNAFVGTEGLSVTETTASSDSWPATHPIVHRFDTFDWFQA
jgi:Ca2+-binding RTX toxin-like protein